MCGALGEQAGTRGRIGIRRATDPRRRRRPAAGARRPARLPRELVAGRVRRPGRPVYAARAAAPHAAGRHVLPGNGHAAGRRVGRRCGDLPDDRRIGLGVVNQKLDRVESIEEIVALAEKAVAIFGPDRVLLNPDCGFATFADNPLASAEVAEAKLAVMAEAARRMRRKHGG